MKPLYRKFNYKTVKQRLVIYELLLDIYKWLDSQPDFTFVYRGDHLPKLLQLKEMERQSIYSVYGFCNDVCKLIDLPYTERFDDTLPELYAQKPLDPYNMKWWFPSRDHKSRIVCLENAIKLCNV